MLEALELNTDLSINKHKSIIYFSKGCSNRAELKALLGFSVGNPSNSEEGIQRIVTNHTNKYIKKKRERENIRFNEVRQFIYVLRAKREYLLIQSIADYKY